MLKDTHKDGKEMLEYSKRKKIAGNIERKISREEMSFLEGKNGRIFKKGREGEKIRENQ